MKLIGKQGETRFLLKLDDTYSRILDKEQEILFGKMPTQSIIARGYWEDYDEDVGDFSAFVSKLARDGYTIEPNIWKE